MVRSLLLFPRLVVPPDPVYLCTIIIQTVSTVAGEAECGEAEGRIGLQVGRDAGATPAGQEPGAASLSGSLSSSWLFTCLPTTRYNRCISRSFFVLTILEQHTAQYQTNPTS